MTPSRIFGYVRVSTAQQSLCLQTRALESAGVPPESIISDVVSGATQASARRGLGSLLAQLRPGDRLVVWRLDRLGRNMPDIVRTVEDLVSRDIAIVSLVDGIDATTPTGRMMLGVLASLAEFERSLIQERTLEGMAAAKARGVRFGRPPVDEAESAQKVRMAKRAVEADGMTAAAAAALVGWSRATLYRHMRSQGVALSHQSPRRARQRETTF